MGDYSDVTEPLIQCTEVEPSKKVDFDGKVYTLEEALEEDDDLFSRIDYTENRFKAAYELCCHQEDIEALVAHHLGISQDKCKIQPLRFINGSFNGCIPVDIETSSSLCPKRVYFRTPLAYKVGEAHYPGNIEERLRCEVATYLWLRERHPRVPIVTLRGYGFGKGQAFTPIDQPTLRHIYFSLDGYAEAVTEPTISACVRTSPTPVDWSTGYMIVDAAEGEMLYPSFVTDYLDGEKQNNLYHDLARITVDIAQSKFPHIGSLTVDDNAVISLSGRPALYEATVLENCGGKYSLQRDQVLNTTEELVGVLLDLQDERLRHVGNAFRHEEDGKSQMGALVALRALQHHFRYSVQDNKFPLQLSDLHASNIFVDEDWHITNIIDLEWAYSGPSELLLAPYWLNNADVDGMMLPEERKAFEPLLYKFLHVVREEERTLGLSRSGPSLADVMRWSWDSDAYWYYWAIICSKGMLNLYSAHLLTRFGFSPGEPTTMHGILYKFWTMDADTFVGKKMDDLEMYKAKLQEVFSAKLDEQEESEDSD